MLEDAERHVRALGLHNVRFERSDITAIRGVATGSVDGVMSTMSLHHLPALADLRRCFAEAARILKPGGALYMVDFGRLKSLASVRFFAYRNTQSAPELFARDFELSLRAAFLPRDFRTLARELLPANVAVHAMFPGRLMVLLRTPPTRLDPDVARELNGLRLALPERYRAELDNMRLFFKFGGVRGDPFNT
jgi:SAM-dependent methyltransferase